MALSTRISAADAGPANPMPSRNKSVQIVLAIDTGKRMGLLRSSAPLFEFAPPVNGVHASFVFEF
jgi:hypothetical protein